MSAEFLGEDFLLQTQTGRRLYHEVAEQLPIFDYHCHLPPDQIASNHQFRNLAEIWLGGDHYKWRAMRTNGISEKFCTGDASDYDKFLAFARTVPQTVRNPLYHWTHLELRNYFGIKKILNESTAKEIWDEANALLTTPEFTTQGLLHKSKVTVVCTTDDPADDLVHHRKIREEGKLKTRVYPTFRPDKALTVNTPDSFNAWVQKLESVSGVACASFEKFLEALDARHKTFHEIGGCLSDHGMEKCYDTPCSKAEAQRIFDAARAGKSASVEEHEQFAAYLMIFFGELDFSRNWTKQLHLGAMRNNNGRLMRQLGADTGFDSIGDFSQARPLGRYLDALDSMGKLPKTILYNLNPADNYVFATMIGNFQDGTIPGKLQFGSGWWFLDQKEAMEWQMNALSNLGLLSRFVGMLTDSRSFLSYPRHEYFRRILCNLIGRDVDNGEIPADWDLLQNLIRGICYENAVAYFGIEPGQVA
ncbi:MAG: glucuronate isomerase [Chthoniobacterales bacterium]